MHKKIFPCLCIGSALAFAVMSYSAPLRAEGSEDDFKADGELGLYTGIAPGLFGGWRNPPPGQLSMGIALAAGHTLRYHVSIGYSLLNGYHGLDFQGSTLGYPIQVVSTSGFGLALEPLVKILGIEIYFRERGKEYYLETAVGVQAILMFKKTFMTISPLNWQYRFVATELKPRVLDNRQRSFVGINLPVRLTIGMRF